MKNLLTFVIGFFIAIGSCFSAQMVLLPEQPFPNAQKTFVNVDSIKTNNGVISYEIWEGSYDPFRRSEQGGFTAVGYFWKHDANCNNYQYKTLRMGYLKKERNELIIVDDKNFSTLNLLMPAPPSGSSKHSEISYICQKFNR
jgi:hypothetical protein